MFELEFGFDFLSKNEKNDSITTGPKAYDLSTQLKCLIHLWLCVIKLSPNDFLKNDLTTSKAYYQLVSYLLFKPAAVRGQGAFTGSYTLTK